eukprot:SAG31_NODE_4720_length_3009_cov_51.054296_1_plen_40_part_10
MPVSRVCQVECFGEASVFEIWIVSASLFKKLWVRGRCFWR